MSNFLYGVSCQGIQSFIFETDKLREIVGGSELVEQLCTYFFEKFLNNKGGQPTDYKKITGAAGNIRYVFKNEDLLKATVYDFPWRAAQFAPGITISQAVVSFAGELERADMDTLERKLKSQRNKLARPMDTGFLAMERCRRTARPAVKRTNDGGLLDMALSAKRKASGSASHTLLKKLTPGDLNARIAHIPFEMEEMTDRKKSGWLAVIHADGNDLGKTIQSISKNANGNIIDTFRTFSQKLETATVESAKNTFGQIIIKDDYITDSGKFPIRPIVIGGDDLTVICRADLALDFTKKFLEEFEEQTKDKFKDMAADGVRELENGLTACAGIAFIKPKYPFHYGAALAEELCSRAKKASKKEPDGKVPSSIAFFKVRSTFLDSYEDIVSRELTAGSVGLDYGPYAVQSGTRMPNVNELQDKLNILREEDAPVSSLRKWLASLYQDEEEARQRMSRICQLSNNYFDRLGLESVINDSNKTPVGDWLSLLALEKGE